MMMIKHTILPAISLGVAWHFGHMDMSEPTNRTAVLAIMALGTMTSYSSSRLYKSGTDIHIPVTLVRVIDGDTVEVISAGEKKKIRLEFIDAPEIKQPSGEKAAKRLKQLLKKGNATVVFDHSTESRHRGRDIARLYTNGIDVQLILIKEGLAFINTQFKQPWKYTFYYALAQKLKKGIHGTGEEHPARYRADRQKTAEKQQKLKQQGFVSKKIY